MVKEAWCFWCLCGREGRREKVGRVVLGMLDGCLDEVVQSALERDGKAPKPGFHDIY